MIKYCYIKMFFDKNVKMDEYLSLLLQLKYGTFFGSTSKRNNENEITFFESKTNRTIIPLKFFCKNMSTFL